MPGPHLLEELPFPHHRPEARKLVDLLAKAYVRQEQIRAILQVAGVPLDRVNLSRPARSVWMDALSEARDQELLGALIQRVLDDPGVAAIHGEVRGLVGAAGPRHPADGRPR